MSSRTSAAAVLVATTVLAGCGQTTTGAGQADKSTTARPLSAAFVGHTEPLRPGSLTAQDIAIAQQRFGLDLMAKVCGRQGPNTLVSPASAAEALGMLDAAAGGSTGTAVSKLLHLPAWSPAVVAAVHDHEVALASLSSGTGDTVRTSNRVWPAVEEHPTQTYLDDVQTAYGTHLRSLDFAQQAKQATSAINDQVSKDTDGLIQRLFDSTLSSGTAAVLTDAIVLKAKWQEPFTRAQEDFPFTTAKGPQPVRMMRAGEPVAYASRRPVAGGPDSYQSGTLAAVAMLPPENARPCDLPTAAQLGALLTPSQVETNLTLPRLHLEQTHELRDELAAMGLPLTGDYVGLGAHFAGPSQVLQKDVMTVDELGTVASGATAITGATATPGGPQHWLSFDRPFLLMLEDVATHSPLFLAWIGDPSAD